MAATTGDDNWKKNWKGSDRSTVVKKSAPYYNYGETRSVGSLPTGSSVVYIDALSESHTRVAIKYNNNIFYTNVDNLTKPKSLSTINLQPQAFGIVGIEYGISDYIRTVKEKIKSRSDITGDLETYLLDLVSYSETGTANFGGYDINDLPLADITKYFGEVLGPIHCIKRGLLTKFGLGITTSSKIFIPTSTTEPLLDYYLIRSDGKKISVSAKATGTSNPLKVDIIVKKIKESPFLLNKYQNTVEFKILDAINNNSMMNAPFVGAMLLGIITDQAAALAISSGNTTITNTVPFSPLIKSDSRLSILPKNQKPTTMQLSYACEKKIVEYSRSNSGRFTDMIKDTLSEEIVFVKLSIDRNTKQPKFEGLKAAGSSSIGLVKLRTKNQYDKKSDKMGFQL
jgi:hypothetical protein